MDPPRSHPDWPLVVAYGLGVNSTAMLVEFAKRGIRPDMILFADTAGEKPETYRYMPVIQSYLKEVKFPPVVTVRYEPKTAKAIGLDASEEHRLTWAKLKVGEKEQKASREAWLDTNYFVYWYPLYSDWRMDRAACERSIREAGLPVPVKSACFFCPATKKHEIVELRLRHPELLNRALAIEANAQPNLTSVVGLGRSFAWADFLDDLDDMPLFDCGT